MFNVFSFVCPTVVDFYVYCILRHFAFSISFTHIDYRLTTDSQNGNEYSHITDFVYPGIFFITGT